MAISHTRSGGFGLGAGASEDVTYCASCTIDDVASGKSVSFAVDAVVGVEAGFVTPSEGDKPGVRTKKGNIGAGLGPGAGISMLLEETEVVERLIYDRANREWKRANQNENGLPSELNDWFTERTRNPDCEYGQFRC